MKALFTITLLTGFSCLFSQDIYIEWDNTVGGNATESLFNGFKTTDGDYICVGFSASDISGDKTEDAIGAEDYWIVKLNEGGEVIWDATYGGDSHELIYQGIETYDGGFVFVGNSLSNSSGSKTEDCSGPSDIWVIKIDALGELEWEHTLGGDGAEIGLFLMEVGNDHDIMVFGSSDSEISGDKTEDSMGELDFWLIKLNEEGTVLWDKTIGGNDEDVPFAVHYTETDEFMIIGNSSSDISGDKTEANIGNSDLWLVKVDTLGNVIWDKTIGGSEIDNTSHFITPTADGGYLLSANSYSPVSGDKSDGVRGEGDCWIIKIDDLGEIEWEKTIGGDHNDVPERVINHPQGGYLMVASSMSGATFEKTVPLKDDGFTDIWLVRLDNEGNVLWDMAYGGDAIDVAQNLLLLDDGYVIMGSSESSAGDDKTEEPVGGPLNYSDFWILKLKDCDLFDINVSQTGVTLTVEEEDLIYQWVDCENDFEPIPGAVGQSFTPIANGEYAVIVMDGECEKMSECFTISTSGIDEPDSEPILFFPNPATDILYYNGTLMNGARIIITSLDGKICLETVNSVIDLNQLEKGVYNVMIQENNGNIISIEQFIKD